MNANQIERLKMQDLRVIAKRHGINSFGKTKASLIREIQIAEGNFDCFGSAVEYCDQWGCRFRPLCFDEARRWASAEAAAPSTGKKTKQKRSVS
jgi:hypothetical protein